MNKTLLAGLCSLALAATAEADINVGILLGFTGPIESLAPGMADGAELAFAEVSESGKLLTGDKINVVRADSTCIDAAAASASAERMITADKVVAILGAACSGTTTAVANNVAVPKGIPMVSPSATSPALSRLDDQGLFFRTAPSDARQGQVLAEIAVQRGVKTIAITYTNNDYGKGLADSFGEAFKALGGEIAIIAAHEDGKADYSAEVGALSAAGAEDLAVFGYLDQGGRGIIQNALDAGAFSRFVLADGMIGESLIENIDGSLDGSFGTVAGSDSEGAKKFLELAKAAGGDGDGTYRPESYDAAALIVLAIQAGKATDGKSIAGNLLRVANAPGEKIYPGELGKALEILATGGEIDYQGATDVTLNETGDANGSYKEMEIKDGKFQALKIH
ncbi:MAG: ABC transporter substrate-binding protein [Gammaproteobacteria bacterium]|nr:ABC transporter substrate-binding protein [Gammaproteobacteria bacterium]